MATKSLPDEDHVVRHLQPKDIDRESDPNRVQCFPQAFALRPGEPYLSSSWLEYFAGGDDVCLAAVALAVASTRTVRRTHAFAIGNVGRVREACADHGSKVRVLHEPEPGNPAHAAIRGY